MERRGGPIPEPAPSSSNGDAGAASGGNGPVEFCAALQVVRDKCQRCHGEPLKNGAPVPFITYDDFQAPYGNSGITYGEVAIRLVKEGIMPYVALNDPPSSIMPPVELLTTEEKETLLGWLEQGRMPEGGTSCP